MILTREKRGNGQAGIFCRSIGLVAVMLAALLPASPAWSQEENAAAPAAVPVAPEAEAAEKPLLWMPEAISTYGQGVDDLFWLIFWITGVAWVIVMGLMLYFLIRYRHREGRESDSRGVQEDRLGRLECGGRQGREKQGDRAKGPVAGRGLHGPVDVALQEPNVCGYQRCPVGSEDHNQRGQHVDDLLA